MTNGLGLAAILAAMACVQVLLWPRLPHAPLPPAQLQGWRADGERAGHTDRHSARSVTRRFQRQGSADGNEALQLTMLAQTADSGIEVAAFTTADRDLSLKNRRLLRLDQSGQPLQPGPAKQTRQATSRTPLPPLREVALGQIQGQPALQACLTPTGHAVTATGTQSLLFRKATTLQDRWSYLARSWPPRPHSCLLVTLRGPLDQTQLLTTWQAILPPLQSRLAD